MVTTEADWAAIERDPWPWGYISQWQGLVDEETLPIYVQGVLGLVEGTLYDIFFGVHHNIDLVMLVELVEVLAFELDDRGCGRGVVRSRE